jgi:hypothetical protein
VKILTLASPDVALAAAGDAAEFFTSTCTSTPGGCARTGGSIRRWRGRRRRVDSRASGQDAMYGRRRGPPPRAEPHGPLSQTHPQTDAPFRRHFARPVRGGLRAGGAVPHRLAGIVAISSPLDGRPGDLESCGDLADQPAIFNDESSNLETVAWCQGRMSVCRGGAYGIEMGLSTS